MTTSHAPHAGPSTRLYLGIWHALAVLLLASMALSQFPLSKQLVVTLVLALSTIKALLVAMYYMHLRFDRRWLAYVVAFPLLIIALAVGVVLSSRLVNMDGSGQHPDAQRPL
jgi:cytochrome c oxidase subunit 4